MGTAARPFKGTNLIIKGTKLKFKGTNFEFSFVQFLFNFFHSISFAFLRDLGFCFICATAQRVQIYFKFDTLLTMSIVFTHLSGDYKTQGCYYQN